MKVKASSCFVHICLSLKRGEHKVRVRTEKILLLVIDAKRVKKGARRYYQILARSSSIIWSPPLGASPAHSLAATM